MTFWTAIWTSSDGWPPASCRVVFPGKCMPHVVKLKLLEGGRNGFDGIESLWEGVPGSELPLNDRKTKTANNTQFAYAA